MSDNNEFYDQLESNGETAVREKLALGTYGSKKKLLVIEWLRRKEQEQTEQQFEKTLEINLGALSAAKSSRNAAWTAAVIAILAFVSSIYFFTSSGRKSAEDILIKVGIRHGSYEVEVMKGPNSEFPAMIPVRWKCQVVNNGPIPVTLMKYRIDQFPDEIPNADQKIGISLDEKTDLRLPISLKPNDYRTVYLAAAVLLDRERFEFINDRYPIGSKTSNFRIRSLLLKFMESKKPEENEANMSVSRVLPPISGGSEQRFLVTFETSRGNRFTAIFSETQQY